MTNRAMPTNPLEVEASEFGFLRVFALDREEIVTRHGLANLIGTLVDSNKVEVVDTKEVEAMGLANYLIEGYGIAEDDIVDDAEALNAIDGHVALIPTSAFGGTAATLNPSPPLRFIGLYAEAEAAPPAPRTQSRSSDLPELESQDEITEAEPKKSNPPVIVLVALLLAGAIVGYLFL